MNKSNKKGFTLAELLIVVAIIAVLVAIAIPVFTSQLEKARQATDAANLRAAYAEASIDSLEKDGGDGLSTTVVKITSNGSFDKLETGAKIGDKISSTAGLTKDKSYKVKIDTTTTAGKTSVDFVEQP